MTNWALMTINSLDPSREKREALLLWIRLLRCLAQFPYSRGGRRRGHKVQVQVACGTQAEAAQRLTTGFGFRKDVHNHGSNRLIPISDSRQNSRRISDLSGRPTVVGELATPNFHTIGGLVLATDDAKGAFGEIVSHP